MKKAQPKIRNQPKMSHLGVICMEVYSEANKSAPSLNGMAIEDYLLDIEEEAKEAQTGTKSPRASLVIMAAHCANAINKIDKDTKEAKKAG